MSVSTVVKKVAPWIGTIASLAPIPGAPLIGMAAKALTAGLNLPSPVKADPQSISDAITTAMADPAQLIQIKKIDDDFAVQMKQIGFQELEDVMKLDADDVANARQREIATHDWFPRALACVVVILCISGEGYYFLHGAPPAASPELIGRILGTLDAALMLVLSYYYGSSMGSDRKTELLAQNGNGGK